MITGRISIRKGERILPPLAAVLTVLVVFAVFAIAAAPDGLWPEEQKLTASDAAQFERFGAGVAISGDDALVGAPSTSHLVGTSISWTEPGAAYIFRHSGGVWTEIQQLLAFDGEPGDRYGGVVEFFGNLALVAAPRDDIDSDPSTVFGECGSAPCLGAGSVYVYGKQGDGPYAFQAKLIAADGIRSSGRFSYFGSAVDMTTIVTPTTRNTFAIIGAPGDDFTGIDTDYGSAYIFERFGDGSWTQRQKLTASDSQLFDNFGFSVAIDGNTAMVGAIQPQSLVGGTVGSFLPGKVYVFRRVPTQGIWIDYATLTPSDGAGGDRFGGSIALSGNTALISARQHSETGTNSGVVYVFNNIGGTWTEVAQLTPSDLHIADQFGSDLAMDGDRFVAGAHRKDGVRANDGAAYVFRLDGGGNWLEDAKIVATDPELNDFFGFPVAISGDKVIVGSQFDNPTGDGTSDGEGAAYIFGFIQPPTALCQDVTVSADANCLANASIDNGSFDPDGDPITLTQNPPGPYSVGQTVVTLTVDDGQAQATCQATVTVVDDIQPVIACPADTTLIATGKPLETTYSGPSATATDFCGAPAIASAPSLPATLSIGQHTITYTATDASGNTASCTQTVTVVPPPPWTDATTFPLGDTGDGRGVAWGDYDNDGNLDLYLSNVTSANKLFRNNGDGGFIATVAIPGNFSFESPGLSDGDFQSIPHLGSIPYWQARLSGAGVSVWNPSDAQFSGTTGFPGTLPGTADGAQVVVIGANSAFETAVLNSIGSVPAKANTIYTLTVALGKSKDRIAATAEIVIVLDGVEVASTTVYGSSGQIPNDSFADFSTSFTTEAGDVNKPLTIRLRGIGAGSSSAVAFDNVRLVPFIDATTFPLADVGGGMGVAWGDYDNDGDLDLYLVNFRSANKLFQNDGVGGFTDATGGLPLGDTGDGFGMAWGDYDNDGHLDLFVANNGGNKLFRNDGVGGFTDVTSGPLGGTVGDRGVAWGDYDNDGDLDLYLANAVSGESNNKLFRNDGAGGFTDVTSGPLGGNTYSSGGVAWGDYDNDGDLDLYLANNGTNQLLRNSGPPGFTFTDVTSGPVGDDIGVGQGVAWGDYDNDGDLDLYVVNAGTGFAGDKLLRNDGGGVFSDATSGPLGDFGDDGVGVAWGDYDNDGDLDLYVANDGANKLFQNEVPVGNHWLHIDLVGVISNRSGIGARVRLVAGGVSQIREVSGGSGFLSQNSLTVEFGVGSATVVDLLEVTWPSGIVQALTGVSVDQRLEVEEANTPVGTSVVVTPADQTGATPVTVTFAGVDVSGNTSLTSLAAVTSPPVPNGFVLLTAGVFGSHHYDLTTTASVSGPVTVCTHYDDQGLTQDQEETNIRLFHAEEVEPGGSEVWVDRTFSLDTENNIICAEVTSLSPFAIFAPIPNVAPTVGPITTTTDPVSVGTEVIATADFTDPDVLDTHTAEWDWGDGTTSPGTVDEAGGSGNVSDPHTYDAAGVYTLTLTVTDDGGASGESFFQFVVVYDPSAGFITGGGFIDSPAGAYVADPDLTGKANFGFVSKYEKGAEIPTGNTEFNFKAGDLNFHSDTYQWLLVNQSGTNAQYKGDGTINGDLAPNNELYKFMIWAKDLDPDGDDTFRIRIWYEDGDEVVVYGNIKIHTTGGGPGAVSAQGDVLPEAFALLQNHPNPFNPTTTIRYDVPRGGGHVTLRVYNVSGQLVRTLVSGFEAAGQKSATWDATDDRGQTVSTGIYFYQLKAEGFSETRKMLLMK
jgi:hypothetical protein